MKTRMKTLTIALAVLFLTGFTASAQPEIHYGNVSPQVGVENVDLFGYTVTYYDIAPIRYFDPPVVMLAAGYDDMHPRKAVDSDDDVHIVWMNKSLFGTWEIYYREMDSGGNTIVAPKRISDYGNDSMYPSIALDSANDAHVVWADNRSPTWKIYYSKVQDNAPGTDLTVPDVRISDTGWFDSGRVIMNPVDGVSAMFIEHPDIDVDSNNSVHIVWSDERDGQWEVYYQKQDNSAIPVVSINDMGISETSNNSSSQCPVIAVGPNNYGDRIHIAWQDYRDGSWEIYYQRQANNGIIEIDDVCRSHNDGYNSAKPDIDVDTDGYTHIAYMDNSDGLHPDPNAAHLGRWEIYSTAVEPDGDPDPRYHKPKRQSDLGCGSGWGCYYPSSPDGYSMYPRIVSVGANVGGGCLHLTWHDNRDGNWEIYYSSVPNWCHNPHEDIRITNNNSSDMYPDIAVNTSGNPDIKWQSDRLGNWDILNAVWDGSEFVGVTVDEGTPNEMRYPMYRIDPTDTNAVDGIIYVWGMPLQSGSHTYRFNASNGTSYATGDIGLHDGPVVHEDIPAVPALALPGFLLALVSVLGLAAIVMRKMDKR